MFFHKAAAFQADSGKPILSHRDPSERKAGNRRWTPMNADSFQKETASARSDTEPTVTNEAQPPEVQVLLSAALIGVHRRPSAVPEGFG